MATLPPIKRILQEDVPNAPSWFGRAMYIINTYMQNTYNALSGQLTFVDNILGQYNTISFTTQSNYSSGNFTALTFPRSLGVKAKTMVISQILNTTTTSFTPILNATSLQWQDLGNGTMSIGYIAGLSNNTTYTVTVLTF